jgi:MoaA/NifB/PqqE/SkfB family radical SAM enzyme
MYIHNVRYGFATNSSSSHSIILLNDGVVARDNLDYQEYGWDFFTAASEKAKREYMGQVAKSAFVDIYGLDSESAAIIATEWAGVPVDPEGYIDHQSIISLPCEENYGHLRIVKQFFDHLLEFVLAPNIAIGGGNDNCEEEHPLISSGRGQNILRNRWSDEEIGDIGLRLMVEYGSRQLRARYDERGKFWTLFSVDSGTKIRTSFVKDANAEKSEVPELVDVKITDHCEEGCSYCYQGSSPNGKHAEAGQVRHIAMALGDLKTFEVAIGGGEPTSHPRFIDILRDFKSYGVKPNFSTRNVDWLVENYDKIKGTVGAVGLSVDGPDGLGDKLSKLRDGEGHILIPVTVHLAVGVCSEEDLKKTLEVCKEFGVTLLLLGWKNVNRGESGPKYPDIDLKKVLDQFKGEERTFPSGESYVPWEGPHIAFDTVLAQEMEEWLEENSNRWCFSVREGAHSMYIDCVSSKMGRSSYEIENLVSLLPNSDVRYPRNAQAEHIKEYFSIL